MKRVLGLFFSVLIILSFIGCSKDKTSDSGIPAASFADSTVVAIVNGEAIHIDDIEKSAQQIFTQMGAQANLHRENFGDTLRNEAFNWIVSMKLLNQEATRLKIEPEQKEIDEALQAIKSRFPSEQQFQDALLQSKVSMDDFLADLKKELKVHKLLEDKVVKQVGEITNSEVQDFYIKNEALFLKHEKARVHHILLRINDWNDANEISQRRAKGQQILNRLKIGESFETLARQFSDDPSAAKGGDLGEFSKGDMLKEFEDAAFRLNAGQFSDLVQSPLGFHIIRLDERVSSEKIPFETVEAQIRQRIQQEKSNRLFEKYVIELRNKAEIKIRNSSQS